MRMDERDERQSKMNNSPKVISTKRPETIDFNTSLQINEKNEIF